MDRSKSPKNRIAEKPSFTAGGQIRPGKYLSLRLEAPAGIRPFEDCAPLRLIRWLCLALKIAAGFNTELRGTPPLQTNGRGIRPFTYGGTIWDKKLSAALASNRSASGGHILLSKRGSPPV